LIAALATVTFLRHGAASSGWRIIGPGCSRAIRHAAQIDAEALIDRPQDFALDDIPTPMSESQVDAALGLLHSVLPDLHAVKLYDEKLGVVLGAAPTHRLVEA
jgi:DNA-binding transcriptional LysR family regulator